MAVQSAAEFVYRGLGKERCCKSRPQMGQFPAARVRSVGGGPYENYFTLSANSGMGV